MQNIMPLAIMYQSATYTILLLATFPTAGQFPKLIHLKALQK